MEYQLSHHAEEMLKERRIEKHWLERTVQSADWHTALSDGVVHYYKAILEYESRILHVVVNIVVSPPKVVTVYFDRSSGKSTSEKG